MLMISNQGHVIQRFLVYIMCFVLYKNLLCFVELPNLADVAEFTIMPHFCCIKCSIFKL